MADDSNVAGRRRRGRCIPPPMMRLLGTLASAGSLLLCVGVCAFWARSYRVQDLVSQDGDDGRGCKSVGSYRGRVAIQCWWAPGGEDQLSTPNWEWKTAPASHRPLGLMITCRHGCGWPLPSVFNPRRAGWGRFQLIFHYLHAASLAAFLPAVQVAGVMRRCRRRRGRARNGLCVTCGYDLRATPHRCPECGAAPAR